MAAAKKYRNLAGTSTHKTCVLHAENWNTRTAISSNSNKNGTSVLLLRCRLCEGARARWFSVSRAGLWLPRTSSPPPVSGAPLPLLFGDRSRREQFPLGEELERGLACGRRPTRQSLRCFIHTKNLVQVLGNIQRHLEPGHHWNLKVMDHR